MVAPAAARAGHAHTASRRSNAGIRSRRRRIIAELGCVECAFECAEPSPPRRQLPSARAFVGSARGRAPRQARRRRRPVRALRASGEGRGPSAASAASWPRRSRPRWLSLRAASSCAPERWPAPRPAAPRRGLLPASAPCARFSAVKTDSTATASGAYSSTSCAMTRWISRRRSENEARACRRSAPKCSRRARHARIPPRRSRWRRRWPGPRRARGIVSRLRRRLAAEGAAWLSRTVYVR